MPPPTRSIGQVMAVLKADFPDVSISKIRFLEGVGLLSPERAPSGYRKYSQVDIDRLVYILTIQRDNYLPLRVIKDHLEILDAGGEPPAVAPPDATTPISATPTTPAPESGTRPTQASQLPEKVTRRQLLEVTGIGEAMLIELERHHLVTTQRGGGYYGREAMMICVVARKLQPFGLDTRHFRAIHQSAEREVGLVEQAVAPYARRKGGVDEAAAQVTQAVLHMHAAMVHSMLNR